LSDALRVKSLHEASRDKVMTRLRSDITTTRNQEEKGLALCRLGLPTIAVLWAGRLVNGWWVTGRPRLQPASR
jgi:hypothetical protein